jgi:hypothetical protein
MLEYDIPRILSNLNIAKVSSTFNVLIMFQKYSPKWTF